LHLEKAGLDEEVIGEILPQGLENFDVSGNRGSELEEIDGFIGKPTFFLEPRAVGGGKWETGMEDSPYVGGAGA
jgi:hypothetical protein